MICRPQAEEPEQRSRHLVEARHLLDAERRVDRRRQLADAWSDRQRVAAAMHDHVERRPGSPERPAGTRQPSAGRIAACDMPSSFTTPTISYHGSCGRVRVGHLRRADAHAMTDRIPSGHHEVREALIDDHDASVRREIAAGERAARDASAPAARRSTTDRSMPLPPTTDGFPGRDTTSTRRSA